MPYTHPFYLNRTQKCSRCGKLGTINDGTFPNVTRRHHCNACVKDTWHRRWLRTKNLRSKIRKRRWMIAIKLLGRICACCSEDEIEFLNIEHIGGRRIHGKRKDLIGELTAIEKSDYDRRLYGVLCVNCNWATRYGAVCPHKRKLVTLTPGMLY